MFLRELKKEKEKREKNWKSKPKTCSYSEDGKVVPSSTQHAKHRWKRTSDTSLESKSSPHEVRSGARICPVTGKHPIRNVLAHSTTDMEVSELQKLLEIPGVLVQPALFAMHRVSKLSFHFETAERVHGVRDCQRRWPAGRAGRATQDHSATRPAMDE